MTNDEWYYRIEPETMIRFTFDNKPSYELYVDKYAVLKRTRHGVWISTFGGKKFINHDWRKKFAHPTVAEALESFAIRKQRYIELLRVRLVEAEQHLAAAQTADPNAMKEWPAVRWDT